MASYNKFQDFSEQLIRGVHDWDNHVFKIALTNVLPVNTQDHLDTSADHLPPTATNGYPSGGTATTITVTETNGTTTVTGTKVVFTATAGGIGPFQYAILYNDTAANPSNALIGWWDYASPITLANGETFTVKFNDADPGIIFILA